jgi:penicillin-binding protein 1A
MRRAFEHACRQCARQFSPEVDLQSFSILVASCPHCGFRHGYDNRAGKILELVEAKLGQRTEIPVPAPKLPAEPEVEVAEPDQTREIRHDNYFETTTNHAPPEAVHAESAWQSPQPKAREYTDAVPERNRDRSNPLLSIVDKLRAARFPGWRRSLLFGALAATIFVGTLGVIQTIPVTNSDAEQALLGLKARQADVVFDRNGRRLNTLGVSQSVKMSLSDFHKWQIDALLFSEDRHFYSHRGVHYASIMRAALNNLLHLRYAQGASTITQQLSRTILQNRRKSIFRKLSEVRLARGLENILSKQQILELYINHVYLGHGNYSFASAAQFYYGKPVGQLSVNEYLSIVALIPSPEKFSPLKNSQRLLQRMQTLYSGLTDVGFLNLPRDQWERGMDSVVEQSGRFATETAFGEKSRIGLWPAQFARDFLMQRHILLADNQNSARVHTTIDLDMQTRAEELVQKHLNRARQNFRGVLKSSDGKKVKERNNFRRAVREAGLLLDLAGVTGITEPEPQIQAALIALSPRTGEILAMVGGESFESKNQLNRTVQMRRQTGSAIKPFIYAGATSRHLIHPATLIDDTPYVVGSGSKTWAPENINGGFEGPMPARDALAKSRNIPAIRVGRLLGRESVTEIFSDFFFQTEAVLNDRFTYDETVAIGTISMSPLEMARAFAVFANNGYMNNPIMVTRVEARDKVMDLRKTHPDQLGLPPASKSRLLSAAEIQIMVSLLKSSGKNSGSGVGGILGKTGTSSESRDLWFVGAGSDIVVAVWFGFDDMRYSVSGATGSALAAKLAGDFLRQDFNPVKFKMTHGMVRMKICPLSGRIASDGCPHARSEVFLSGVTPEGECLHGVTPENSEFIAVMGESQFR